MVEPLVGRAAPEAAAAATPDTTTPEAGPGAGTFLLQPLPPHLRKQG
jgi:hypothetical protein